jgi:hypothetical protein
MTYKPPHVRFDKVPTPGSKPYSIPGLMNYNKPLERTGINASRKVILDPISEQVHNGGYVYKGYTPEKNYDHMQE